MRCGFLILILSVCNFVSSYAGLVPVEEKIELSSICKSLRMPSKSINKSVNIVFIPSGWNDNSHGASENSLRNSFDKYSNSINNKLKEYLPFALEIDFLNIIQLTAGHVDNGICTYNELTDNTFGCNESEGNCQYVNCEKEKVEEMINSCFDQRPINIFPIVLSNNPNSPNERYERAIPVVPTNFPTAAYIPYNLNNGGRYVAHELGHTIFDLGDEGYEKGTFDHSNRPNCRLSKSGELNQSEGTCEAPRSIMSDARSDLKFGELNQKIACCKYELLVEKRPTYCDRFNQSDLNSFCAVVKTL